MYISNVISQMYLVFLYIKYIFLHVHIRKMLYILYILLDSEFRKITFTPFYIQTISHDNFDVKDFIILYIFIFSIYVQF